MAEIILFFFYPLQTLRFRDSLSQTDSLKSIEAPKWQAKT